MPRCVHTTIVLGALLVSQTACALQQAMPSDPADTHKIPPFTVLAPDPNTAYARFMIIGDMGTGQDGQREVATAMALRAKKDGLDFMLGLGDNFYESGVASVDDPQWKTKFEDIYADDILQVSYYATLGNHDHKGNAHAQVEYSHHSSRWRMPARHYTFDYKLDDGTVMAFFALDTQPIHKGRGEAEDQIKWLDKQLGKSKARWKIVFGHHPLYSHSIREPDELMIAMLEPVFTKHKVDLYLAGHDHTLEMLKPIKGVNYIISGAAAGRDRPYAVNWTDESYYAATLGGFVFIRASAAELLVEFVRLDGKTQYAQTISK